MKRPKNYLRQTRFFNDLFQIIPFKIQKSKVKTRGFRVLYGANSISDYHLFAEHP